jgi:chromosomal replication initiator protein
MLDTIWLEARRRIRSELPEKDYQTWIEPLRAAAWDSGALTLETPSHFFRDWLRRHFLPTLQGAVSQASGREASVVLVVNRAIDAAPRDAVPVRRGPLPVPLPASQYTLDKFVVGASNQVAYAAALAIVEQPGTRFNPFLVYGGSGLGKTHLTRAIGRALTERQRGGVACLSAENFVNDMIGSIRGQRMDRFRQRFRGIDTLIIDDVQFLAGKLRSQEEFLHTFNALHDGHKQIVLACDRSPRDLPGIEETLRNRFAAGLLARIELPDPALRRALVRRKAAALGLTLDEELMDYLAEHCCPNVRELEGALKRLEASATLSGQTLTVELAREVFGAPASGAAGRPMMDRICEEVCAEFGLRPEDLRGRRRTAAVATARQVAMYLGRHETDLPVGRIGAALGGRDHSTVVYALGAIERRLQTDAAVKRAVDAVRSRLRAGTGR